MDVKDIKIEDIEIIENVRISVKDKSLIELMSSIKQHGLLQPIGVGKTKTNKFVMVYGHRRLAACKKLGWKTVPAVVEDIKELKDHMISNITENLQRKDNSPLELGRVCNRLMKEMDMTVPEISARLSVSKLLIQGAIDTYSNVPYKLREKVKFMNKSGRSKEGEIPATFVQKVMAMRRQYKMSNNTVEVILKKSQLEGMAVSELGTLSRLLAAGMTPAEALKSLNDYMYMRVDFVVRKNEIEAVAKKHKITPQAVLGKIIFGKLPSLTAPKFGA